jgi:hypothetical protein
MRLVTARGGRGTYPAALQAFPEFEDISWGNDVFDSVVLRARGVPYRVWVAQEDPHERERDFEDVERYVVMRLTDHGEDTWGENQDADNEPSFASNDPAALVAWFLSR